jgi:hypothetical protein
MLLTSFHLGAKYESNRQLSIMELIVYDAL